MLPAVRAARPRLVVALTLAAALLAAVVLATAASRAAEGPEGTFTKVAWTAGAAQPFSVSEAQGEVVGGRLLTFGGFDSQKACCTPTARAYALNPATGTWTPLRAMPAQNGTSFGGVTHAGFATDGTDVFWAGGYTANASGTGQVFGTREVWRYDVSEDTYARLPDLPVERAGGQLEVVAGKLHHFGGTNLARTQDVGDHWALDLANPGAGWQQRAALPNPRHHMGSDVLGGRIYAVGGQHGHDEALTTQADVHVYDPASDAWTQKASLPSARGHVSAATVAYGGRLLVLGGETAHNAVIDDVVAYDPATNSWSALTDLPAPRRSGVAGAIGGKLLYTGGGSAGTSVGLPDLPGLCEPVSDLACSAVAVNLPHTTSFGAGEGGLADKDGQGTGFTMVQPSTGGTAKPDRVDVDTAAGELTIRTTKGLQYKTPSTTANGNTLDNGLGVGLDASRKLRIETTLVNPPKGTGAAEQGGLWFGPTEDDYVKLVVASAATTATPHRLQLLREVGGASTTADEVNTLADRDLSGSTVRLVLEADPAAGKVSGTYQVGSGAVQALGELTVPASFFDGTKVPANARAAGATGFAGIFASHRNNAQLTGDAGLTFRFGEFRLAQTDPPAGAADMEVGTTRIVTNEVTGGTAGPARAITIRNRGRGPLQLEGATLAGTNADQFRITQQPATTVAADGETTVSVAFDPTSAGPKGAVLRIRGNDPDTPVAEVALRGLGTIGLAGGNEPSLQWILDTHEIPLNVGDDAPSSPVIHSASAQQKAALLGPDEIAAQTFRKAGAGVVTVEPLAVFGPDAANPLFTFNRHAPGSRTSQEVFRIGNSPASGAQTVDVAGGARTFDPGSEPFGLSSAWPFFANREVFGEDRLNTFSGAIPHHVRVYPLKATGGTIVPNAYVMAIEETTSGFDFQDLVVVLRNVEPVVAASAGEIGVENLDKVPFADRLAFNRIQTPDAAKGNGVHDQATVRISNTGTEALTITGLPVNGPWQVVDAPALPRQIAVGATLDVTVKFVAQNTTGSSAGRFEGSLTIQSNDADEASLPVQLGGFWQSQSENGQEPDVDEIVKTFGYGTTIRSGSQQLNNGGRLVRIGDEVHSAYWKRADLTKPVVVRQLAAFHTQGNVATFAVENKTGSTAFKTNVLTHAGFDGQSFLPRKNNAGQPGGIGEGTWTPANAGQATFGFNMDGEHSDWRRNTGADTECRAQAQTDPSVTCGHHVRIWPVEDRAGRLVANQWLVSMDYSGINYDFNDNVYLVTNVRPEDESVDPNVPKPCTPVACDQIAVDTPYELDFADGRAGTALDRDGQGTGFTHVDKPTNTSTGAVGYLKDNLDVAGGALRITTTKGLQFSATTNNPDSQDNMLGVGLTWGDRPLALTTTVLEPPAGTRAFEQGGLWFGRGGDDYVKLVVGSLNAATGTPATQIQVLKEQGGLSGAGDECKSAPLDLAGKDVALELLADPATRRVAASYTVEGGAKQALPCTFTVPASWFSAEPAAVDERIGTSSFAGVFASHRNATAPVVFAFDRFGVAESTVRGRPSVTAVRPADGATGVALDASIGTDLALPNPEGGVDTATLGAGTVKLTKVSTGTAVAGTPGTTGGGDAINFTPAAKLEASTQYRFEVTDGVKDLAGQAFVPFSSTFTTGTTTTDPGSGTSTAAFDKVALPTATAPFEFYAQLAFGPDGKLYAAMNDGRIRRFPVAADGTLGQPQTITSLVPGGSKRLLVGLRFDPDATAANPVLWVSHTTFGFSGMADWGGKITRLSGADLQNVQDVVVNLPRSARDHVSNGLDFGPDGALYLNQGSNSAMGAPDNAWSNREERALSAAVLRIDVDAIGGATVDVKTEEGGTYDPRAAGAPVTVFGSGVRNAYDLVWHSNGQLYVPTNGSAAGGNTPGTPASLPASCAPRRDGPYTGPSVPGITDVSETQHDWLFRVVQGGYYGHPNPKRCEWVLNGGDPTTGTDPAQVSQYPDGTQPDRNWRGAAFDFGLNKSPNGVIEYRSSAFGGTLKGKLLVVRYSQNDDIIALTPGGAAKDITASQTGIPGTAGFKDPLDLTEDPATGNLYVSEYDQTGSGQRITLLRVKGGAQPTGCSPWSTLPCAQVGRTTPVTLGFDAPAGGLAGTGFTMVQPSSGGGALKPERLSVTGGRLVVRTTKGIQFKTPTTTANGNTLDNGLGVGLDTTRRLRIETTLVNPPLGTGNAEQGGVWFGPGEDDYAKVVVASAKDGTRTYHRLQLLRELGGASAAPADEINVPATTAVPTPAPDFSGTTVRLALETDPASGEVTGYAKVGDGPEQKIGELSVPAAFFDGSALAADVRAAGVRGFAGLFATHRNNPSTDPAFGLDFGFGEFTVTGEAVPNRAPQLATPADQAGEEGDEVRVPLQATDPDGDAITWSATGLPAGLEVDRATGVISGTLAGTAGREAPYTVTVTASDDGEPSAQTTATFAWRVAEGTPAPPFTGAKVNFQSAAAQVPTGYVRDFGQPYGRRTDAGQGTGLSFGWVVPGTSTGLDLSVGGTTPGNGRERNLVADQRLDTFMHLQADDVTGTFNGTKAEGAWELAVPDGTYDVTLGVGDPQAGADPERHTVRAEGRTVVDGFVPAGANGTATRQKVATLERVAVSDGRLTIDAVGGQNTKVAFVDVTPSAPVNHAPAVTQVADQTGREGDVVDLAVQATDADGDDLAYTAEGLPAGLQMGRATGRITGTLASTAGRTAPYAVTVTVSDDATPGATTSVAFTWRVDDVPEPGDLEASAAGLAFGDVLLGRTATKTVTLRNAGAAGAADITVAAVAVGGEDAASFSDDRTGTLRLAPGQSADVAVAFAPTTAGAKRATLAVEHDGANADLALALTGTGVAPDTRAPETTITSGPSGLTKDASPSFGFTADEDGATFACRLDDGAWGSCTSPKALTGLADGAHTFAVRATDAAGNTDATPATRELTVDTAAPAVTITEGPEGTVTATTARFAFTAEAGATLECALDAGTFGPCTSPRTLEGLTAGAHAFRVRATDAAGNTGAVAQRTWTVGTAPPATGKAIRINAGGPAQTVGGTTWSACATTAGCSGATVTGGFAYTKSPTPPITAPVAPANAAVHHDEWTGGQTNGVPAGARAFGFDVPVANGAHLVRLHFSENNQNGIGKRVFDVDVEGGPVELTGLDLFKEAGGMYRPIVRELRVTVADGNLDLDFIRRVENAKVDGIEVIALDAGTPDTTPPGPVTGLKATAGSGQVALTWTNPGASDLAAVRVLRSTTGPASGPQATGGQQVVYEGTGTSHTSTGLTNGTAYTFTVFARDAAGNWSTAATVQATPQGTTTPPTGRAVRFNAGGPAQDVGGVLWSACTAKGACGGVNVIGGFAYTKSPLPAIQGPLLPANQAIYQSEWTGGQTQGIPAGARAFGFDVFVPNGRYLVRLHFAENNQNGVGKRVFDVNVDDGPVEIAGLDLFKEAGGLHRPLVKEVTVDLKDGKLDLDFIRRVENAKVSGVEVLALG